MEELGGGIRVLDRSEHRHQALLVGAAERTARRESPGLRAVEDEEEVAARSAEAALRCDDVGDALAVEMQQSI